MRFILNNSQKKKDEDSLFGFFILLIIISIVWFVSIFVIESIYLDLNERGIFGDSFGSINSLFSGLALGGIIYTIFQQKKELSLQRLEISKTREEFVTQNTTLRLQRFENTFFNLLNLHHQIVNSIDLDIDRRKRAGKSLAEFMVSKAEYDVITIKGRDVFKLKLEELNDILKTSNNYNSTYLKFYETIQTDFGHYFRNLYRIIKMVDETVFITKEEYLRNEEFENEEFENANYSYCYKYTSMVRAQLSDYELLWLFYNCLSDNGIEKFKPLIESYCLLKNMPKDKILNSSLLNEYKECAYSHN